MGGQLALGPFAVILARLGVHGSRGFASSLVFARAPLAALCTRARRRGSLGVAVSSKERRVGLFARVSSSLEKVRCGGRALRGFASRGALVFLDIHCQLSRSGGVVGEGVGCVWRVVEVVFELLDVVGGAEEDGDSLVHVGGDDAHDGLRSRGALAARLLDDEGDGRGLVEPARFRGLKHPFCASRVCVCETHN